MSGGFSTAVVLPFGAGEDSVVRDQATFDQVRGTFSRAYSNYALSITATPSNVTSLDEELKADAKSLFIPADFTDVSSLAAHFAAWPSNKLIVTNAKGSALAPILLLAGLHNRNVHVTDVQRKEDLLLIALSKAKDLNVTCDVSVYSLFFNRDTYGSMAPLPTAEDQKALWDNLASIDVFSTGTVPYYLARSVNEEGDSFRGISDVLPLLLTAVSTGRLTLKDVQARLHDNPVQIFALPDQAFTSIEVVIGRKLRGGVGKSKGWSPAAHTVFNGTIHRVFIHGQTAFLDGELTISPSGRDVSSASIAHQTERRSSISVAGRRPDVATLIASPAKQADQLQPLGLLGPQGIAIQAPANAPSGLTHLLPHPSFHRKHILSVKQFAHRDVHELFSIAHEMQLQVERNGTLDILKGKVLATLFYEPSTRTSSSFDAAMKRCGGEVVAVNVDASSVLKGETLPDTIRTLGCYADGIVIRHPDVGSSQLAAKFSPVPVINAGDGIGEHPTQVSYISNSVLLQYSLNYRLFWTSTLFVRNLVLSTAEPSLFSET